MSTVFPQPQRPHGELARGGLAESLLDVDDAAWSSLDQLSRALRVADASLEDTLAAVLHAAVEFVSGAEAAGLNLFVKGKFTPQAVLGTAPPILGAFQQRTSAGPCIDASREQCPIDVVDTRSEDRWPPFAARAVELGVLSMLCVPLWVDDRRLGSLSLFAPKPAAFDEFSKNVASLYATHAALALADAQRTELLRRVVANRDVIGQAKGVLMARRGLPADDAFGLLVQASQRLNRKLVEIAEAVATTGELPG
ncbi:GAF and ANTAR domain-containing protein [Mycolicibacterium sp.]|uniref:GAF and ANTAR domain-containing protein n=1 Tax=Mycolicibacterium sp. TaxID=2320850 RepID=UPI001A2D60DA|nr:GAF and ANTAR domain-containing protein [Mycolicibacterium sp.]MBJ7337068.1 GAF and ANTAR domain-containing protein [Mycolicibacterium sp.]